ncbi:MAG: hypothetical protein IH972_07155 [Candidatus Marinimicrobia bacterium]|nr:hypothetical protein [Candidatus Neomarinimicrobiota bacterium]
MSTELKRMKLELGLYQQAEQRGLSFTDLLGRLDDGAYLDPESALDPFQQQMAVRNLITVGPQAVQLEAFYETDSRFLFPEWINRQVREGMSLGKNALRLSDLVSVETEIDSGVYEVLLSEMGSEVTPKRIGQGGEFPTVEIKTGEQTIKLSKYGIALAASYEAIRRVKAPIFAATLRKIGFYMGRQMVDDAITALVNGTGNNDAAAVDQVAATGTLDYSDLITFDLNFDPFESDYWVAPKDVIKTILNMVEFKDPQSGFTYQQTGDLISPLGNILRRYDGTLLSTDRLVGFMHDFAIEKVTERNASLVEVERIINKQIEGTAISEMVGFAKIDKDATRVLDISF